MHIVVVGCGFAGLEAARRLRKQAKELEITMIDRKPRFDYQPAYPELLSGKVTPDEISCDLNPFATKIRAEFIHAEVVTLDLQAKKVKTEATMGDKGGDIPYDFLLLAIGAEQTFFGIPGAGEHSCSVNTLKNTIATKNALDNLDYPQKNVILVIGAGLTGVEVAGELVDYFRGKAAPVSIYLVEMMPRILPALPKEKIATYVSRFLSHRGVEILTETAVQEINERKIVFKDGRELAYDRIIWTAGIKPNRLLESLDVPRVKGWLKVDSYLRVEGMHDVFAVGDTALFDDEGVRSGQNVEEANRQGKVAAENIIRAMKGKKLKRYRPKNTIQNPRALISLGDEKGVMYLRGMMVRVFAYRLKKFVEHCYMRSFR
jgi:NADH dehydrogenase